MAEKVVAKMLGHVNEDVRIRAWVILSEIATRQTLPTLETIAKKDPSAKVGTVAKSAIAAIKARL